MMKLPAEISIYHKKFFLLRTPNIFVVFKFLQLYFTDPSFKPLRVTNLGLYIGFGFLVIQNVMILGISQISQHVFRVLSRSLLRVFLTNQLFQPKLFNQLILKILDFQAWVLILLILSVLQVKSILRARQHGPWNRQTIFKRKTNCQTQRAKAVNIEGFVLMDVGNWWLQTH